MGQEKRHWLLVPYVIPLGLAVQREMRFTWHTLHGFSPKSLKSPTFPGMQEIIIQATFDKEREVRICMPTGSGVIQIFIDNYYQGVLTKMHGVWTPYLNPTILTGDDISVIIGMVE